MASKGSVTLRGRFAPGDKVELVDGRTPDPLVGAAIKSATVSDDGEVTFDGLEPGASYVVRDKGCTRQAQITARAEREPESSLIPTPKLHAVPGENETPTEPVPRVVHKGARGTRQLTSTRGDTFAGEAGEPGRLTKPADNPNPARLRQADFGGEQMSDTPIGQATPVVVEESEVERRHLDVPDPASHLVTSDPKDRTSKRPVARQATPEEIEKAVKPPKSSKSTARSGKSKRS